jgi:hypothetical protein
MLLAVLGSRRPTGDVDLLARAIDSANGLSGPVNFSLGNFGKAPKTLCEYLLQLEGHAHTHPTQVGGAILPNSDQLPSA